MRASEYCTGVTGRKERYRKRHSISRWSSFPPSISVCHLYHLASCQSSSPCHLCSITPVHSVISHIKADECWQGAVLCRNVHQREGKQYAARPCCPSPTQRLQSPITTSDHDAPLLFLQYSLASNTCGIQSYIVLTPMVRTSI